MSTTTAVKERPILFSGQMVKAILSGRKTQTRRVVKPQPHESRVGFSPAKLANTWYLHTAGGSGTDGFIAEFKCPYGTVGDRLWVRETWGITAGESTRVFDAGQVLEGEYDLLRRDLKLDFHFRADGERREVLMHWRPSIHMPRSASRITLEITGVRVERVQEITPSDALAEGVDTEEKRSAVPRFYELWSSIHKHDGPNGFAANPWVWVVEFKRIKPEESE